MAEFVIRVADERGKVLEKAEAGFSAAEIRDRYQQSGYLVYWVKPRGFISGGELRLPQRRRVTLEQFVIFNQQFLTLVRAGLPIVQALDLLAKRQRNQYFRMLLEDVRDRAKGGELISEAFEKQGAFPKIYSTTLMAGEKSGNLDEVLSRYVAFQRLALSFRKKLISSLVYPVILVLGVIALITMLVTFVIPKFADLFADLGQRLPAMTEFTITTALAAKKYLPLIVLVAVAIFFLVRRWTQTQTGAEMMDRIKLNLPIVGSIWQRYQIAVFSRMMSTLLSGGLPLVTALETAGQSMASRLIVRGINDASKSVREGRTLAQSLEQTGVFPDLAVEMVEVGEATGALPTMLSSIAEFYEEDVQSALSAAMSLIEPAILVGMGIVVGFILISLYLPIFSFTAG
ncbi:MAG TPA: type II secretion system F family protein [Candidatus Saccharimonadales bacterium]|nr:type II secretion system F family protein [Candidatus Saccharimonadales bacterium]